MAAWLAPVSAQAYERQWHVGGYLGYGLAGFAGGPYSGFGAGAQLSYGVTDIVNLRVHSDVSAYPLPAPLSSAVIWNSGAGVELAFDVVQLVPYVGATVGPAYLHVPAGEDATMMSLEVPLGALYYLSRDLGVGGELRYRALLFGPSGGPLHNMAAFFKVEYVWGY